MEEKSPRITVDQTHSTDENAPDAAWVSPEVAAAQDGERVEMGKNIVTEEIEETD